jgi:hypothetical protein
MRVESCRRFRTLSDHCRSLRDRVLARTSGSSPADAGKPIALSRGSFGPVAREFAALLTFPDESRGWIGSAVWRGRSVIRQFQPHVVVSSGPPHAAHLVAALALIGANARWFIDLRDPWAGPFTRAFESHPNVQTRMFRAFVPRLERLLFRLADGLITNTPQLAEALAAKYPGVTTGYVPNGVDLDELPEGPVDPYPGLGITYAGTLYGARDLGPVVRALAAFLKRHPEARRAATRLRVAGDAQAEQARTLSEATAAEGIAAEVELLGLVSRAEALSVIARSRLALVLAQGQALQIPAKLYESVAMGIPTLVLTEPGTAAAREGERVGAFVRDPCDIQGIIDVLEQLWCGDLRFRPACPVPITYDAIAPLVERRFTATGTAG